MWTHMFFFFGEKVLCFHFLARNSMISSGFWGQFRNVGSSWLASHMRIPIYIQGGMEICTWLYVYDTWLSSSQKIKRMHVMCVPFCLHVKAMWPDSRRGKENCWGQQLRDCCIQDHFHMCKGESKIARSDVLLIIELSYDRITLEPCALNASHTQI